MTANDDCVELLQWALPRLGMRWRGFRRVRRQVCRRIRARQRQLALDGAKAYRAYLQEHPEEWPKLDAMCRVTISRFWRNGRFFDALPSLLQELAQQAATQRRKQLRCWSAGCASGEEPYSIVLAGQLAGEIGLPVEVVATDAEAHMLTRAQRARYSGGTLRELEPALRDRSFERVDDEYQLNEELRTAVSFLRQDLRQQAPAGRFDLVLCRNLAFTYFDETAQGDVVRRLAEKMHDGGALLLGAHEALPAGAETWFEAWPKRPQLWRRHSK